MLHSPQALAQHVTGVNAAGEAAYSANTASVYLYAATGLLRFPEVQQLMSAQAVVELKQCVRTAVSVVQARTAGKAAAAAARQQLPPLQQQHNSPAVQTYGQELAAAAAAAGGGGAAAAGVDSVTAAAGSLAAPCANYGSTVAAAAAGGAGSGAAAGSLAAGSGLTGSKRTAEQQVSNGAKSMSLCAAGCSITLLFRCCSFCLLTWCH
jgi:hypothetical protein